METEWQPRLGFLVVTTVGVGFRPGASVSGRLTGATIHTETAENTAEEKGFEPLVEFPQRRFSKAPSILGIQDVTRTIP